MIYLLFYDISDDRARTKIAKLLIAEGYERIQFSVFTSIFNPFANKLLWESLQRLCASATDNENDKLCVLNISKLNFKNMKIIGKFEPDMAYLTGEKQTLFV